MSARRKVTTRQRRKPETRKATVADIPFCGERDDDPNTEISTSVSSRDLSVDVIVNFGAAELSRPDATLRVRLFGLSNPEYCRSAPGEGHNGMSFNVSPAQLNALAAMLRTASDTAERVRGATLAEA